MGAGLNKITGNVSSGVRSNVKRVRKLTYATHIWYWEAWQVQVFHLHLSSMLDKTITWDGWQPNHVKIKTRQVTREARWLPRSQPESTGSSAGCAHRGSGKAGRFTFHEANGEGEGGQLSALLLAHMGRHV